MKKINLLFTIWGMTYGGAERFVLNVIKNLDKSKYNITVFSDNQKTGPMQQEFIDNGAEVIYAKFHRFKHPIKYKKQLKEIIRTKNIDIIHANDDLNMIFPLLAKPQNVKFIAHSHNTKFRFTKNPVLSAVALSILPKFISSHSDLRFSCGEDAGRALFGNDKFEVVFNGIEIDKFNFSEDKRKTIRRKYKIKNEDTLLLNIGRLDKQKNQLFLVDVFTEYYKINKNSKLMIIGDGPEEELLKSKIIESGLSKNILLIPSQNNVADFYNAADVFILTSLFEGMPVVSIEAQANGLKCVFSDTISKEADHSGRVDFLSLDIGPKQWAEHIVKIKTERVRIGRDRIKEYDIKNITNELSKTYFSLTHGDKAK